MRSTWTHELHVDTISTRTHKLHVDRGAPCGHTSSTWTQALHGHTSSMWTQSPRGHTSSTWTHLHALHGHTSFMWAEELHMDTQASHGHTSSAWTHLHALHGSLCLFTFQACHCLAVIRSLLGILLTPGADRHTGWCGADTGSSDSEPRASKTLSTRLHHRNREAGAGVVQTHRHTLRPCRAGPGLGSRATDRAYA